MYKLKKKYELIFIIFCIKIEFNQYFSNGDSHNTMVVIAPLSSNLQILCSANDIWKQFISREYKIITWKYRDEIQDFSVVIIYHVKLHSFKNSYCQK